MTELEFGARLKQLRQQKHLTQQELADQLGVSNKSVSRWESGGYPDISTLAPLAKVLGVSVDELLGCQPPLRTFGRSDWQNLMSYAFALGGGVVFYLFDLFMPAVLCYLLYLAMMAYGVYLQRHYTYHSRWFYAANGLMDFCINLKLTAFVAGGSLLTSGVQDIMLMMMEMEVQGKRTFAVEYVLRLLLHMLPWLLLALGLTGATQMVICRTAGEKLRLPKLALRRTRLEPVKLLPVLSPVLLAGFWWVYNTENPVHLWIYKNQTMLFLGLWLVTAVLAVLSLVLTRKWNMLPAAVAMQLSCLSFLVLAGQTRAYSTVSGKFLGSNPYMNAQRYYRFGQGSDTILAVAAVLILLYLLCCLIKIEKKQ